MTFTCFVNLLHGKFSYLIRYSICFDIFIACVEVYNENLASHGYVDENGQSTFMPFSDNHEYSSLILHPKWTHSSFLKFYWGVRSETVAVNFSYLVALKFTWLILLFELIFHPCVIM